VELLPLVAGETPEAKRAARLKYNRDNELVPPEYVEALLAYAGWCDAQRQAKAWVRSLAPASGATAGERERLGEAAAREVVDVVRTSVAYAAQHRVDKRAARQKFIMDEQLVPREYVSALLALCGLADGGTEVHRIPGSYVEFAERRVLDDYAHLPASEHSRLPPSPKCYRLLWQRAIPGLISEAIRT
jgi:hypothetical protein